MRAFRDMKAHGVRVGFLETAKYLDGTPAAYVATIMEFGYPAGRIPARPFFRPTMEQQRQAWADALRMGAREVLLGKLTAQAMLAQFGAMAAGEVSATISKITSPPLSPVTLELRRMRKAGRQLSQTAVWEAIDNVKRGKLTPGGVSTKPLVDSGFLIQSVDSEVVRR